MIKELKGSELTEFKRQFRAAAEASSLSGVPFYTNDKRELSLRDLANALDSDDPLGRRLVWCFEHWQERKPDLTARDIVQDLEGAARRKKDLGSTP